MRANIKDIINEVGCTEKRAEKIEQHINDNWLLDWSECEMSELNQTAREVNKILI